MQHWLTKWTEKCLEMLDIDIHWTLKKNGYPHTIMVNIIKYGWWLPVESRKHVSFYLGLIRWMGLHPTVDLHFGTRIQYLSLQTSPCHLLSIERSINSGMQVHPPDESQVGRNTRPSQHPSLFITKITLIIKKDISLQK